MGGFVDRLTLFQDARVVASVAASVKAFYLRRNSPSNALFRSRNARRSACSSRREPCSFAPTQVSRHAANCSGYSARRRQNLHTS